MFIFEKHPVKCLIKSAKFTGGCFSEVVFWKHLANGALLSKVCKSVAILQTGQEQMQVSSFELAGTAIAWAPALASILPQP